MANPRRPRGDGRAFDDRACQAIDIRQPTLSKLIDRMAAAQLVQRRTPSDDHRRSHIHLTTRGLPLATKLALNIRQREALIARVIGSARTRKLKVELIRLIGLLEHVPIWAIGAASAR
jgi:DNA-binding MarR family transcriptional regulator